MRRYDIVKGDATTAGGIVQAGDGKDLIGDREQAYENDPVWCPPARRSARLSAMDRGYQRPGRMGDKQR